MNLPRANLRWAIGLIVVLGALWMAAPVEPLAASAPQTPAEALHFFTNVADRLLQSQLGLSLTRIQVCPTNQYSPAVHRLLQVAANLLDATTNTPLPSVFRPQFGPDPRVPGGVVISSYVLDNNADTAAPNVHGIPYVIGVKKGLPGFNELMLKTAVQAVRKLEIRRPATNLPPHLTNEMFLLSITNFVGVEIWNPYRSNHLASWATNFQISISNVVRTSLTNEHWAWSETNEAPWQSTMAATTNITYSANPLWGFIGSPYNAGGFLIPLSNTSPVLTQMIYRPLTTTFEAVGPTNSFTTNQGQFFTPQWGLNVSGELTCMISAQGKILDFVHLPHIDMDLNLNERWIGNESPDYEDELGRFWQTNRVGDSTSMSAPTDGILRQIVVSRNPYFLSHQEWRDGNNETVNGDAAAQAFNAFLNTNNPNNAQLAMQTPFNPIRRFTQTVALQADDPLVHRLREDLQDSTDRPSIEYQGYLYSQFTNHNLGQLNPRYRPWGGNPLSDWDPDPASADPSTKDPGVRLTDHWAFPTNLLADPRQIGRVHRGTPWQSLYLKSGVVDPTEWMTRCWDLRTHPTNDWHLASVLVSLWSTNDPRRLFSVNEPGPAAWKDLLHGMTVLSNQLPVWWYELPLLELLTLTSNSPQAGVIADGIQRTRLSFPSGYFPDAGDILSTPELSLGAPWLDLSDDLLRIYSVTDLAYERLSEQLLPLIRSDPVGAISLADGQRRVRFVTWAGTSYAIETSANLRDWEVVQTGFTADGVVEFTETMQPSSQHFYRLVIP